MVEKTRRTVKWNSNGGRLKWNSTGGSVKVKQGSGILTLGTVKVEQ